MEMPQVKNPVQINDGGIVVILAYRKLSPEKAKQIVMLALRSGQLKRPKKGETTMFTWHE